MNLVTKKAKSNSLLYIYDTESKQAHQWVTYDKNLDSWTKAYLGENPKAPQTLNATPCLASTTLNSLTQQLQTQNKLLYLQFSFYAIVPQEINAIKK
jgi:hypothetical protein